ncbi:MAG: YqaJ viral recombinase family protein [Myxococcota bacterium]
MEFRVIGAANDRRRWLARRHELIGASEAASLWPEVTTRFHNRDVLLQRKVLRSRGAREDPAKFHMFWGTLHEDDIIEAINIGEVDGLPLLRWGDSGEPAEGFRCMVWGKLCVRRDAEFIGATPDAVAGPGLLVEVKNPTEKNWMYWRKGPPWAYWAQVQHQMLVTGADQVTVAARFGARGCVHLWPVERHQSWIEEHEVRCRDFWAEVKAGRRARKQEVA